MTSVDGSAGGVRRRIGLQLLFLASGAPGLAAQLAWTRVFAAGLGHEWPSLLGVVSAFFLGLAVGAACLDAPIARSSRPVLWYVGLECGSAVWMALTVPLLSALNRAALTWIGFPASTLWQAGVALVVPLLVVGPCALAMGATLPAMERAVAPLLSDRRAVAGLYALNTAGAVLGVTAAMAWLMPQLGFRATLWIAASVQAGCGLAAWTFSERRRPRAPDSAVRPERETRIGRTSEGGRWGLQLTALVAGGLGIGFELLGLRALAQTTENTVQTYAAVLIVFLAATAIGAAALRWAERHGGAGQAGRLPMVASLLVLAEIWVLAASPAWLDGLRAEWGRWGAEWVLALAVFALPAAGMGAFFAHVTQAARGAAGGVGRALAANTLGGALAAPGFVGLLLPAVGLKGALVGLAAGYLALGIARERWLVRAGAAALFVLLAVLSPARLQLLDVPARGEVRRFDEGWLATVAVLRGADGHRVLRVNNHFQQGGTATAVAARRHAQLPLLLHPEPRRALFLGVGTGITLGAAATHPGLRADGVELLPGVVAALPEFEPENGAPQRHPNLRVFQADARRFVRVTTNRYDVVVADLFHPAEDGAGFLYTREHFAAMRACLAPGGLVCQWLPLHQLDLSNLRTVARTFQGVFPDATLWLLRFNVDIPVVALVGTADGRSPDPDALARRMAEPGLAAALKPLAMTDPVRVLGCRLADAGNLRQFAGDGAVATDDRPLVLFGAAAAVYTPEASPPVRLMRLLAAVDPGFDRWPTLPEGGEAGAWRSRLRAFRVARDRHLHGLVQELEGRRREALEDYLASAAASADYTAGYAQAVLVASAYAREDPALSRQWLERLVQVRPDERLAREVLQSLKR